jgi:hypothetical protein
MRTSRVQELLEKIGYLSGDELEEARQVARQHFEISDEEPTPYDKPREKPFKLDDSPPVQVPQPLNIGEMASARQVGLGSNFATIEQRLEHAEKMQELLWRALHQLEQKIGVGKEP